jgi:hypothetical protein
MSSPIDGTGAAGASQIESGASAPMSPTQKMSNLFDQIDPTGSGTINQSQFNQAFQTLNPPASFQAAGSESVWSNLEKSGVGDVSKSDFVSGMTTLMKELRGAQIGSSSSGAQQLATDTNALDSLGANGSAGASDQGNGSTGSILSTLA